MDSAGNRNWFVVDLDQLRRTDVGLVGGKNASLGEMIGALSANGIKVPPGFATTSTAYWRFIEVNNIRGKISQLIRAWQTNQITLAQAGQQIRQLFLSGDWPADVTLAICDAYQDLAKKTGRQAVSVAVRSSATAEDLPNASFAGQQETFLNVSGEIALLDACRGCYASLFSDRAISYRQNQGFDHLQVALSIGVQCMVRSDLGCAGVMFTVDTESGFDQVVLINATWGLGETIVQGAVNPDEYQVFKPFLHDESLIPILAKNRGEKETKMIFGNPKKPTRTVPTSYAERNSYVLTNAEILKLARWACIVEEHYQGPMDIEWAKDGWTGELFLVQARPETVHSHRAMGVMKSYRVNNKGRILIQGCAVGDQAVTGRLCLIENAKDIHKFVDDSILVTHTTDPDWVPIMRRARAIITDRGGRTSHAAIVSRELGVPAVVGAGNATRILHSEQDVTVSCAEGDTGVVYHGHADIDTTEVDVKSLPTTKTDVMINLANPSAAYRWWKLPIAGIGLARMEFVISSTIQIHPMALAHFEQLHNVAVQRQIENLTSNYSHKPDYFIEKLARGLGCLCAIAFPKPVIIRMSDFKTNEYANLIGGKQFEPKEENPMLGFRGASRYYSPSYKEGFALECKAIRYLREMMGFLNTIVMIPFCRTTEEAAKVLEVMAQNGLKQGEDGLQVYMMCEIPANVILASQFAEHFDGFSVGSNDLTQLTLGVDRDSVEVAQLFDERNPAAMWMIARAIQEARKAGRKIGFCGQAPSNHPEFAAYLVQEGITSISVSPDSFVQVKRRVYEAETAKE